ncbi:MAG TPA: PAS domain-containing protein, partial [Anaerolineae bacterium]|nr:PAS domain-containing protein [Anaerolineae bacterium]
MPKARKGDYWSLFQKMPVGLYRISADGMIMDANPALLALLGFPDKKSLLQLNLSDLYMDPSRHKMRLLEIAENDVVYSHGLALRRADGTVIRVDDYTRAIRDGEGKVLAFKGCMIDATGRNVAEGALR